MLSLIKFLLGCLQFTFEIDGKRDELHIRIGHSCGRFGREKGLVEHGKCTRAWIASKHWR